jgi:hypothetical protein
LGTPKFLFPEGFWIFFTKVFKIKLIRFIWPFLLILSYLKYSETVENKGGKMMESLRILASSILFLLLLTGGAWADVVEDFEDGVANDWSIISGNWEVVQDVQADGTVGQVYKQTADDRHKGGIGNGMTAYECGYDWTDYTFEADVKMDSGGDFWMAWRSRVDGQYYAQWFRSYMTSRWSYAPLHRWGQFLGKRWYWNYGKWYRMKAEINGPIQKFYVDDNLLWQINHGAYSKKGTINFRTLRSRMTIDNVVVTGEDITGCLPPDSDNDGVPDDEDNCPAVPNTDQADFDGDGIGDVCDPDDDNDDVADEADNCQFVPNTDQADFDGDGAGDACDQDDDNDDVADEADNCQFVPNTDQADFDGDELGNACDPDADNDDVADEADACLFTPLGSIINTDGCSIAQLCPADADYKNHGAYVSCVAEATNAFKTEGLITGKEKGTVVSEAAKSDVGK